MKRFFGTDFVDNKRGVIAYTTKKGWLLEISRRDLSICTLGASLGVFFFSLVAVVEKSSARKLITGGVLKPAQKFIAGGMLNKTI